ncbi:MAG: hypothetical protein II684_07120 [Treponema sp.]|nr:hypothetical protein [Treponema sp.]
MKKSFFLMAIILSLFMISCGSTKNVAGNENPLPAASPAENSQPAASPADTDNAVNDSESKADSEKEKKESDTPLEIVSQEDVIQSKPLEDEKEPASTHIEEPQILDAPPAETEALPEFNPNAEHSLAENKPEAVGTTFANPAENTSAEENQKPSLASQAASAENENPASAGSQTASSASSSAASPAASPSANTPAVSPAATSSAVSSAASSLAPSTANSQAGETHRPASSSEATSPADSESASATSAASAENQAAESENSDAIIPLEKQKAVPSRSVTIKNNQYLDIVYPGSGWVYLGETEENRDQKKQPLFSYFGRKLGTADTTFTLRSRKSGSTLLHFYKNDALTGQYIDDYLAVTIDSENARAGERASAPSYAEAVPQKPARQTRQSYENIVPSPSEEKPVTSSAPKESSKNQSAGQSENRATANAGSQTSSSLIPAPEDKGVKTVIQNTDSVPAADSGSVSSAPSYSGSQTSSAQVGSSAGNATEGENNLDLLEQAKRSYAAKQYEKALEEVQAYLQDASDRIDQALYLQGQILEAESSVKNIRSSIDSYETLTKNYPMSSLWGKANNRIIYLKRFYIEIR